MLMEQSSYFKHVSEIYKLFDQKRVPDLFSPTKDTPLYIWSQSTKYHALQTCVQFNIFNSLSFYWIDFGIHHVATPNPNWNDLSTDWGINFLDSRSSRE